MIRAHFPVYPDPRDKLREVMKILQELQQYRGIDADINRALNHLATAEAKFERLNVASTATFGPANNLATAEAKLRCALS